VSVAKELFAMTCTKCFAESKTKSIRLHVHLINGGNVRWDLVDYALAFFRSGTEITVGSPSRHYTLRGRPDLIWQMGDVLPTENRREMIVSYHVQDRACSGICCFLFNMIVFPCTMACRSQETYDPNRIFVPTNEEQPRKSPDFFLEIAMREVSAEQAKKPRLTSELKRLANLRSSGALTEEQYNASVNKVIYGK